MFFYRKQTLKVSRRYFLPTALTRILIIWNVWGHVESKTLDNSSSNNASHPYSSPLISSLSTSTSYNSKTSSISPSSRHEFAAETFPRFSTLLHKFSLQHEPHMIAQLAQSRTANLHKLLHKLHKITSNPRNNGTIAQFSAGTKVMSGKLLGVNKIAASIPSFITSNTRLKRQLEGIFHVRGTSSASSSISTTTTTRRPSVETTPFQSPIRPLRYKPPNGSVIGGGGGGGVVKRIRKLSHGKKNLHNETNSVTIPQVSNSPKKETEQTQQNQYQNKEDEKITTITNFNPKKSHTPKFKDEDFIDVGHISPEDVNGKRNYSVEIVEIARKTVIKEDNTGKYRPTFRPLFQSSSTTPKNLHAENSPSTGSKSSFKPSFRPRVRVNNFLKQGKVPVTTTRDKIPVSATQPIIKKSSNDDTIFRPSIKYKSATSNHDLVTSSTTAHPISVEWTPNSLNNFHPPSPTPRKKQYGVVEVNINSQEQIPYNDRDVDEADLKDYLDGHSTFGAKGNFKHVVSKNVTGYLPNSQDNTKSVKHGLNKRQPSVLHRRSPSRNDVEVEAVEVKVHQNNANLNQRNDKSTIYTATGVPISLDEENQDNNAVFQYSGNKDKPHHFPKLPKSTLDALYKQGHPAIAKAPPIVEHEGSPEDYNPFRANPLVDDVPLKYDPESDRYYGNPTPDKEKLAQSNRPEPDRIQIDLDQRPEYQEEEQKKRPPLRPLPSPQSFTRRASNGNEEVGNNDKNKNDNNDDGPAPPYERVYKPGDRVYEPPDEYDERNVENEGDTFIKDFVSLDNNFQQLPRPSKEEESFRDLIAPEARDESDDQYFEPDSRGGRGSDRDRGSSTRRSNDRGSGRDDENREEEDTVEEVEDYHPGANDDEFGPTGQPDDFDKSYVDALKQFDDEIKQIQDAERNGATTGNPSLHSPPPTSTGEPLVITSPGPAVSYQQQRNAPSPPLQQVTTPTQEQDEQEEDEIEEEQPSRRPDPPAERERDDRGRGDEQEQRSRGQEVEEEEQPAEEESEKPPPKKADEEEEEAEEEDTEDKNKDADESREDVKIKKVHEVKSQGVAPPRDDKSGNLDEDISKIEEEWRRPPQQTSLI